MRFRPVGTPSRLRSNTRWPAAARASAVRSVTNESFGSPSAALARELPNPVHKLGHIHRTRRLHVDQAIGPVVDRHVLTLEGEPIGSRPQDHDALAIADRVRDTAKVDDL
jgi:hypothetical protein